MGHEFGGNQDICTKEQFFEARKDKGLNLGLKNIARHGLLHGWVVLLPQIMAEPSRLGVIFGLRSTGVRYSVRRKH
jgi:hypothetical protein